MATLWKAVVSLRSLSLLPRVLPRFSSSTSNQLDHPFLWTRPIDNEAFVAAKYALLYDAVGSLSEELPQSPSLTMLMSKTGGGTSETMSKQEFVDTLVRIRKDQPNKLLDDTKKWSQDLFSAFATTSTETISMDKVSHLFQAFGVKDKNLAMMLGNLTDKSHSQTLSRNDLQQFACDYVMMENKDHSTQLLFDAVE